MSASKVPQDRAAPPSDHLTRIVLTSVCSSLRSAAGQGLTICHTPHPDQPETFCGWLPHEDIYKHGAWTVDPMEER